MAQNVHRHPEAQPMDLAFVPALWKARFFEATPPLNDGGEVTVRSRWCLRRRLGRQEPWACARNLRLRFSRNSRIGPRKSRGRMLARFAGSCLGVNIGRLLLEPNL